MNLINKFTEELGYFCAVNQLSELSMRFFVDNAEDSLKERESFRKLAERYRLSINLVNADNLATTICLSYIVNVHACFEAYLDGVIQETKKFGRVEVKKKEDGQDLLDYVIKTLLGSVTAEIKPSVLLCDYYRLVRNCAVHKARSSEDPAKKIEKVYSIVSGYDYKKETKYMKLNAPNKPDKINFDDHVMFARTCNELANYIYGLVEYDPKKMYESLCDKQKNKLKKLVSNEARWKQSILNHIQAVGKIDEIVRNGVDQLYSDIVAHSSN